MFVNALRLFILFIRNTFGCINSPYTTYRKIASGKSDRHQIVYLFLLVVAYFVFVGMVRTGIHNPYLLTLKLNLLLASTALGFGIMVVLLYFLGKISGGKGDLKTVFTLWSFSLLPTLAWFFITSILYLFLPPPRTISPAGKSYSLVFTAFTLAVFSWKVILYYLTLRLGHRLDFLRIAVLSVIVSFFITGYSLLMYRLGIFRIPFI